MPLPAGDVGELMDILVDEICGDCAVWIEDLRTNQQWSCNATEIYPAASVIKIPILITAARLVDAGEIHLESLISVHEVLKASGAGILRDLHSGILVTFRDLLTLMIVISDNSATNIVIDALGMDRVNDVAQLFDLEGILLRRKLMGGPFYDRSDYSLAIDNQLTAEGTGKALRLIFEGSAASPRMTEFMLDVLSRQKINDRLPALLPPDVTVAHKTGEFQTTRHDAGVILSQNGLAYVIVVLTKNLDSPFDAIRSIAKFSASTYSVLNKR